VREHTAHIVPPRALWVPFPLGRPFGVPNDAPFQDRVLRAALDLLDAPAGPVLADYPEDVPAPDEAETEGWTCPINLARPPDDADVADLLVREIARLRPWHDLSVERRGRTTVGTSGLAIEDAAALVAALAAGTPPGETTLGEGTPDTSTADGPASDGPASDWPAADLFKQAVEDLKAFYAEAATARPGPAAREDIERWLWHDTVLGRAFRDIHARAGEIDDAAVRTIVEHFLVPRLVLPELGLDRPARPRWHEKA
jgi:hypothetical protein